jgi:hypothetical protein
MLNILMSSVRKFPQEIVQSISRSYEEHKTSTCLPPHNPKGSNSEEHLLFKHSFSVKMLRIIINCLSKTKGDTCRHAFSMISNLCCTSRHPHFGALFILLFLLTGRAEGNHQLSIKDQRTYMPTCFLHDF